MGVSEDEGFAESMEVATSTRRVRTFSSSGVNVIVGNVCVAIVEVENRDRWVIVRDDDSESNRTRHRECEMLRECGEEYGRGKADIRLFTAKAQNWRR